MESINAKTVLVSLFIFLNTSLIFSQTDSCNLKKINFPDGNLKEEGCIKNGKREGVWKEYAEKGYLRFIMTYKDGLKDGPYKALYSNGGPAAIGTWSRGCITDTLKRYDENGDLTLVEFWVAQGSGSSYSTYRKVFNKNAKPDGTIEKIDGKDYLWKGNEKHELHYTKKTEGTEKTSQKVDENTVYALVDKMPIFAEGNDQLQNFLKKNIKYPKESIDKKIEGTVFTNFIVEKNGEISNIKILKGIDSYCNDEVVRVIKLMPKWIPAQKANQNVRYSFNLPVRFTLPD